MGGLTTRFMVTVEKRLGNHASDVCTMCRVDGAPPVSTRVDKTGQPKLCKMLAGGGRRDACEGGQGCDIHLAFRQGPQDT